MDPNTALRDLLISLLALERFDNPDLADCDRQTIQDSAEDLGDWIGNGGFCPDVRKVVREVLRDVSQDQGKATWAELLA